jgi:hypothetical protein
VLLPGTAANFLKAGYKGFVQRILPHCQILIENECFRVFDNTENLCQKRENSIHT